MRFHALVLVACLSLAGLPVEASEAFDKGKADGQAFGERQGKKKGTSDGKSRGNEDGFKKGYEDARLQVPAPSPTPSPEPPAPTEPPVPTEPPTPTEPPAPPPEPTPEPPMTEPPPANPPGSSDDPGLPDTPPAGVSVHHGAPAEPARRPDATSIFEVPLSGKLIDADAFALARASAMRAATESPEEQALREYPDLVPAAPSATTTATRIPGFSDEEIAYGQEYTKGFALGYVESFAKSYAAARDEAYGPAWTDGYARGQAEYKRLANGADGAPLTPDAAIDLARKAMLLSRFEEAVNRLDILIASPGSTAHLDAALYWKAATYYYWGKRDRAIELARKVSANPASAYADDAYFLAGAAYESMKSGGFLGMFGKRHDKEAAVQYETVVAQFASSKIVPSALLRLGACRERLRQKAAAIAAYKRLVTEFAAAPEATRARLRLKALGAESP